MPFFQNVFLKEFDQPWSLGDRQHSPTFQLRPNAGRGEELVVAWNDGPYKLDGNDASGNARKYLLISYSLRDEKNWGQLSVDITAGAADAAAVTVEEIALALNADPTFAGRFNARLNRATSGKAQLSIRQRQPVTELKFYIVNGQAEEAIGFNKRAGVDELPNFFSRHTIANRFNYTDSLGFAIQLDPNNAVHAAIINNAVDAHGKPLNYDSTNPQTDWQLLRGRSGLFNFQKLTVDSSDRITQIIEYPAGAKAGDFARMIKYTYTSSNKSPSSIAEIPYTLVAEDLITP